MSELIERDISCEEWREYEMQGPNATPVVYRIWNPVSLFCRPGGTTHRVVDEDGVVHCLPAPGIAATVLRWKSDDPKVPVAF